MDSKLILAALAALVCVVSARSTGDTPDAIGSLLPNHKEQDGPVKEPRDPQQLPMDDGSDADPNLLPELSSEETEEDSDEHHDHDHHDHDHDHDHSQEEESGDEESSEEDEDVCADISGVYRSTRSDAMLVVIQRVGEIVGLFRNSSEDAWYEYTGVRGQHSYSAAGFVALREKVGAVTAVTALCKPCDGSLDLSLMTAFPLPGPGCNTAAKPMPGYNYLRVGSAERAQKTLDDYSELEHDMDCADHEGSGDE